MISDLSFDEILQNARHRRHDPAIPLKDFDCTDKDLNEFYHDDCSNSQAGLLSVTYIIENDNETIAFYSLLNDKISRSEGPSNNQWNKLRAAKFESRYSKYSSYPCVKLARLGVNKKYQSKGIGEFLINHIKLLFITENRTGCRFITVDAYNNDRALKFYTDNGFIFLPLSADSQAEASPKTRLMYFDLIQIINAQKESAESPTNSDYDQVAEAAPSNN